MSVSRWSSGSEALSSRASKLWLAQHDRRLGFDEVLSLWQQSHEFRSACIEQLAAVPFDAFRWELPALTIASGVQGFECVVTDAPGLASVPDEHAFARQFEHGVDDVAVFQNLGGDATLIVPCPVVDVGAYNHLASFVRRAPEAQKHALFRRLAETVETLRSMRSVLWISTAGAGVSWLHVRLDSRPKYYVHAPYKTGGDR